MKKIRKVVFFCFAFIGCFICTACNGTITREIRHSGFTLSNNTFLCDELIPKDDEDTSYEKIRYFSSSFAITERGNIYELSLGQKYSNNQHCRKANVSLSVVSLFDNKVFKANDGNLYYIVGQSDGEAYSLVTVNDNSYSIYQILLGDDTNLKAITIDQNLGIYYVLKNDGNIYRYTITRQNTQSDYQLVSTDLVYDSSKYGKIIDFNDTASPSVNVYIRTEDNIYRMRVTNSDQCSKYVDVNCEYKLEQDETLQKYYDKIFGYDGNLLITTYGREFNVNS